jgi:hypothetical protein
LGIPLSALEQADTQARSAKVYRSEAGADCEYTDSALFFIHRNGGRGPAWEADTKIAVMFSPMGVAGLSPPWGLGSK